MASVIKLTSSSAGKLIMRPGMMQAIRGAASQVKLASRDGDDWSDDCPNKGASQEPIVDSHDLYIHKTNNGLNVNLENVLSNGLQGELVDKLEPYIKSTVTEEKLPNITFNHIAEEVYLKNLYMTFRKMGYHCSFSRYNGDKGQAIFEREQPEQMHRYSYFRSTKPNSC